MLWHDGYDGAISMTGRGLLFALLMRAFLFPARLALGLVEAADAARPTEVSVPAVMVLLVVCVSMINSLIYCEPLH